MAARKTNNENVIDLQPIVEELQEQVKLLSSRALEKAMTAERYRAALENANDQIAELQAKLDKTKTVKNDLK